MPGTYYLPNDVSSSNYIFTIVPSRIIARPSPADHAEYSHTQKRKKLTHPTLPLSYQPYLL